MRCLLPDGEQGPLPGLCAPAAGNIGSVEVRYGARLDAGCCLPSWVVVQEGEQTWLLAGRLRSGQLMRAPARHEGGSSAAAAALAAAEDGDAGQDVPEMHDVPAEQLADVDSQFLEDCLGLQVHYKMALPEVSR
mgnify:CR=1 FL=1